MNEYIILNVCDPDNKEKDLEDKTLVPISRIKRFFTGIPEITRIILHPVYPQAEFEKFYVKESPSEIEALIMGSTINSNEFKYSHFALPSITANEDPVDYLSDKVNRLIYELEKLEKENAKLKEELSSYKTNLMRYELLHGNTNLHSNPANPCCRETFKKASLYWSKVGISPKQEEELVVWKNLFLDKIEENKNDSL